MADRGESTWLRRPGWRRVAAAVGLAAAIGAAIASQLAGSAIPVVLAPEADGAALRVLAVGRQGYGNRTAHRIAAAMERVAAELPTHAVLYLGDNFHPAGVSSPDDAQWQAKFEGLYASPRLLGMPFFAVLGNHDHRGVPAAQVAYSRERRGSARWRMPATYYVRDFGRAGERVLARLLFLDTTSLAASADEQLAFASEALSAPGDPVWKLAIGHSPLRSVATSPQTRARALGRLLGEFRALRVDAFVSADDRLQQVLDRPGEPLHVSTNGGSERQEQGAPEEAGDVVASRPGFAVISIDPGSLRAELRDADGGAPIVVVRRRRSPSAP